MFKRTPQTKPATPLRSSTRRQLVNVLQQIYPILAAAPPEVLNELVPDGVKQGSALNSNGIKVAIYSEPDKGSKPGRPLWWEAGNNNGTWMNNKKIGTSSSKASLPEIFPTIYALWIVPNLLPILPTWPQVIEGALLSGSALMVPGLLPAPHTYSESSAHPDLPRQGSLVAIAGHPSTVPQVLARLDLDVEKICELRFKGEKGKAATTLHAYQDGLWELGGNGELPAEVTPLLAPKAADNSANTVTDAGTDGPSDGDKLADEIDKVTIEQSDHSGPPDPSIAGQDAEASVTRATFTTSEIDNLLYLALLSAIQDISGATSSASTETQASDIFPMPASAFYSAYVLPHRPSQWPPRPAKGKRGKSGKGKKGSPGSTGGKSGIPFGEDEERILNPDQVVVAKSSAKKLTKWFKVMEKEGLLKVKETRGEATVVEVDFKHVDVVNLTPFEIFSEAQQASPSMQTEKAVNSSIGEANDADHSSAPNTSIHVQQMYALKPKAGPAVDTLFDVLGLSSSEDKDRYYSSQELRRTLLEYVNTQCEPVPKNQALIKPTSPLTEALGLTTTSRGSLPMKREEVARNFMTRCVVEYTRVSRLSKSNVSSLETTSNTSTMTLAKGEFLGDVKKSTSSSKLVKITLKKRQGNKIVSLVTGLESVGIDPKIWANEIMKSLGTSTSVSALQGSTVKNPQSEVLIQGDQRKALLEKLSKSNGVDKNLVEIIEPKK
ncbi:unnamed protein product [Sympodiomycopsis kandeliae]